MLGLKTGELQHFSEHLPCCDVLCFSRSVQYLPDSLDCGACNTQHVCVQCLSNLHEQRLIIVINNSWICVPGHILGAILISTNASFLPIKVFHYQFFKIKGNDAITEYGSYFNKITKENAICLTTPYWHLKLHLVPDLLISFYYSLTCIKKNVISTI